MSSQTPLMKQYWDLKAQADDALLLFRMGDFYELFGDDAVTASRILEITLTSRDKNKPEPLPMAGVPFHSIQGYLQRLLKAGKKVAICEQMDDQDPSAKAGKPLVRRAIVRTLTPAIQFDSDAPEAAYLATAIPVDERSSDQWILACLDAATGEIRVSEALDTESLLQETLDLPIRHWLSSTQLARVPELKTLFTQRAEILTEELPTNYLSDSQVSETLQRQYALQSLDAFFPTPAHARAIATLVIYTLKSQQRESLSHLRLPEPLRQSRSLVLGPRTAQHLDLFPELFDFINHTRSALGARALRRTLQEPLRSPTEIDHRQAGIRELSERDAIRTALSSEFAGLYDLERIAGRITTGLAGPRDTWMLGRSLERIPRLAGQLELARTDLLTGLRARLLEVSAKLESLSHRILTTQLDEPPLTVRDGGIFRKGAEPELDRLLTLTEEGGRFLIELEARERSRTGIPSLKVRYNRVFGYYIEVTQAHLKNVPADYQRKQTTVGAERFFTDELKKFEEEILTSSSRQKALEQQLFESLIREAQSATPAIMEAARALGELDAWNSLARLSDAPGWAFPKIDDSRDVDIQAGRHPIVDQSSGGRFVPNDLSLSPETRLSLLITGPNMGGKSTIMRQVALIVILGQMGAPVPATRARWGWFSSVYTRIGAHDAIARGQSTFMVEMSELAHILHHADDRSLLVLDEIGRGTSTYDGISVAWATLEWLCTQTHARLLFATHYHELTRLSERLPLLANAHMAVASSGPATAGGANATGVTSTDRPSSGKKASLRFLYLLREGAANESFGIHVAKLAGIPAPVVERAWKILEDLENSAPSESRSDSSQLGLFDLAASASASTSTFAPAPEVTPAPLPLWVSEFEQEIEKTPIEGMTPLQALNFLAKLQETARGSAPTSA